MFTTLFVLLLTSLAYSSHGTPLQLEAEHDMKEFLYTRIVGGQDAPPEYGKHAAALVYGELMTHLMCGGSIVTKQHILTAAHCVEPLVIWGQLMASFRAVVGSDKWESTENNIRFSRHVSHPGWNWNTLKNDIAVLFLAEEIKLSDSIAIIPVLFDWVDGRADCFVTGWGRIGLMKPFPEKLQLLHMQTITPQECFDGIEAASVGWHRVPPHDPKLEICTFHSFGHGMCHGDSGSALVQKNNWQLIGIVSWGFPCALGAPDVFVRMSSYKKWFTETVI